jgi:nucleoside phosphorylase
MPTNNRFSVSCAIFKRRRKRDCQTSNLETARCTSTLVELCSTIYNNRNKLREQKGMSMANSEEPSIDVCVVCALAEEAKALLDVVSQQCHTAFVSRTSPRYGYDFETTTIQNNKGEPLALHVSWLPRVGPQETILHLSRVLEEYHPRFVAMTGICAGDRLRVSLGDLVVADRLYTYDSGKFVTDEQGRTMHEHDVMTYQLDDNILRFVSLFDQWKPLVKQLSRPLSKRQQREWLLDQLLDEQTPSVQQIPQQQLQQHAPDWRRVIHDLQQGPDPLLAPSLALREKSRIEQLRYALHPFPYIDPQEARCHIKPMASGSAVRGDNPFKDIQVPVRGTVAVEMEGAAFGRVMASVPGLRWLVVKGVSDYADSDKDDSYHQYAATASALYLLCFLKEYVTDGRIPRAAALSGQQQASLPTNDKHAPVQVESPGAYYSCFISYSREDESFAERLYTDLLQSGARCWFAPEHMKIGDKIRDQTDKGIQQYDKFLIVLSERAIASDWVEKEVETAFNEEQLQNKLILFPIRLDDAVLSTRRAWAADIRRARYIGDFTKWENPEAYQRALNRLLRDLKRDG